MLRANPNNVTVCYTTKSNVSKTINTMRNVMMRVLPKNYFQFRNNGKTLGISSKQSNWLHMKSKNSLLISNFALNKRVRLLL